MAAVQVSRVRSALLLSLLLAVALAPGRARGDDASPAAGAATSAAAPEAAASPVSATGLLPIFGVAVDFDALPTPAAKPDEAVAAIQKIWDQYLKGAGFNVVQFPVDVRELGDRGAGRLAKLCGWAKTNNVRLAPILTGAPAGQPLPEDFPDKAAAFATKTIEIAGKSDPQAYAQIMLYQIERPLNHPASHGPMEAAAAAERIRLTIEKVRAAEQTALAGTTLQATPALASASFDYELIRFGAIANNPITDEAYQQAYESLRNYLAAVVSGAPVDVIALEWFPGSLSSHAVERFPDVVAKLQADLPGKLLVVGTGFSTAAGGEADQSRYYTQAFNNLSDLRTSQGVESSFAGILWRTALDRPGADLPPPSSKTVAEMASWNWPERAAEITRMWNDPGAESKEMRWWVSRIESRFGLLASAKSSGKPVEPKASYQLLARLKSSLAAAAEATGAGDIAKELSGGGGGKGVAGAVKDRLQAALFGMLDAWVAKTAENLVSGGSDDPQPSQPQAPPPAASMADLQIVGLGELAAAPTVGILVPLAVTVYNAGTAPGTNMVLYLRDGSSTDLGFSSPTTLAPGSQTTVELPWTPSRPGNFHGVTLDAYCDNELDASTNHASLGDIPVAASPSPPGGGGGGGGKGHGYVIDPKILGAVKGTLVTKTDPGFVQIETIRSMPPTAVMISGGSSGAGVSPRIQGGTAPSGGGTVRMASGTASSSAAATAGGVQPTSLAFSVTNPFNHPFTQVKATLRIGGKTVGTKDLGSLYARQRRTATFGAWTPPKPGTYPVTIELSGLGPRMVQLSATATDQIVATAGAKEADARKGRVQPTAGGGTAAAYRTASAPQLRSITPLVIAPTAPSASGAPKTRPLYLVPGAKKPMALGGLFGLTANTILIEPLPLQVGKEVQVSIRLMNSERVEAKNVKVETFIGDEKLGETTLDVPVARAVLARGFKSWTAKPGRHSVRAVVTADTRTATAVKPIDIHPPHAVGKGGVALLLNRGGFGQANLIIGPSDIRTAPLAPAAGAPVDLSVRVQNGGTTDAKGARVEIFADGIRVGEATADIPAGKDQIVTGFPKWTPAAGKRVLLARVMLGALRKEATREITIGALTVANLKVVQPMLATGATFQVMSAGQPDLQILSSDITFSPGAPKAGTMLTVTITVRNIGKAAASGASVLGILRSDGTEVTRRQFPVSLAAGATTSLTWSMTAPAGKAISATATATATGDARADNNGATATAGVFLVAPLSKVQLVAPTR